MLTALLTLSLSAAPVAATPTVDAGTPPGAIAVTPETVAWRDGPPSLPKGTKLAVLEGDPKGTGIFTMRVSLPKGFRLAPHTHPRDERVTILSGTLWVGYGEKLIPLSGKKFGPGSFYVNPPGLTHFLSADEEVVMQITGEGPWVVDFAEEHPRDDGRSRRK